MPDLGAAPIVADLVAERARAADVAAGRAPADAIVAGATVVDVYARGTRRADVAIAGGRIAAVGDVGHCVDASTRRYDCDDLYVLPGLIEPHFHVGFSQVSIERLAELLVPMGTIALSGCFSESASIVGGAVVEEQLERLAGSGLDVLLSPFYASALGPCIGSYGREELLALVADERCVEVREWSDGAARNLPDGLDEVWAEGLRRGRAIAGHMASQTGPALQASVARGVRSDHETVTAAEAVERARLGVTVQMREGSALRDMDALLPAIVDDGADPDMFSFCSDEQELHDLVERGHIDGKLRMAVERGVDPIEAVRMATLNAARSMGLDADYGSVTPGRLASLALVEDLSDARVQMTFSRGRLMAERGRYLGDAAASSYPPEWSDTVHVRGPLAMRDFAVDIADGDAQPVRVVGIAPGSAVSEELHETVRVESGRVVGAPGLAKLAMIDRHEASGRIGVGLARGLGIESGAFAATINAGAFNLMVAGVDDEAMAIAANRAAELGGGIVVARDGAVRAELALPLFGIVSDAPLRDSVASAGRVARAMRDDLGSPVSGIVAVAGFACLASYPALKVTDRGLVRTSPAGEREIVGVSVA
ncbi:MAG: adenine deaminase C-terminal domain-containing protein [Thermoleophilaceae bacterium]